MNFNYNLTSADVNSFYHLTTLSHNNFTFLTAWTLDRDIILHNLSIFWTSCWALMPHDKFKSMNSFCRFWYQFLNRKNEQRTIHVVLGLAPNLSSHLLRFPDTSICSTFTWTPCVDFYPPLLLADIVFFCKNNNLTTLV